MKSDLEKINFTSDYMEGAHPNIIKKLIETNNIQTDGYGTDMYCTSAREKIRKACNCPNAEVHFLVGGTQTNLTVISSLLRPYEGVLCPASGHIAKFEAGSTEATGHKIIELPSNYGKIDAETIERYLINFYGNSNFEHMAAPGMVYISQPTEYGTLYSLEELKELSRVCHENDLPLYVDGARLAYALACDENDVTLADLARLTDIFYIGGTKCGALFGEALVIPKPNYIPRFFTMMKQRGALLAKGRILGIQFDVLFENDLYLHIGESAIACANKLKKWLKDNHFDFYFNSPTNQIFLVVEDSFAKALNENVNFSFCERFNEDHIVIRFATSWDTKEAYINELIEEIEDLLK